MSRCRAVKTTIKTQILYQFVAEMKDMSHQISTEIVTFFSCRFLESVRPLDRWDWAAGEGRLLRARMSSREKTRKLRMMMLISMTLSFKRFSANVEWQWWWTKEGSNNYEILKDFNLKLKNFIFKILISLNLGSS